MSRIFPNPSNGIQTLELAVATAESAGSLRIYDVNGRLVWRRDVAGLVPGVHEIAWDGRDLEGRSVPPSVYLLEIRTGRTEVRRKIVRTP